jgi:hypothetical protein
VRRPLRAAACSAVSPRGPLGTSGRGPVLEQTTPARDRRESCRAGLRGGRAGSRAVCVRRAGSPRSRPRRTRAAPRDSRVDPTRRRGTTIRHRWVRHPPRAAVGRVRHHRDS